MMERKYFEIIILIRTIRSPVIMIYDYISWRTISKYLFQISPIAYPIIS